MDNLITVIEVGPKVATVLATLKESLNDKRSNEGFVNSILRGAVATKCKAEARMIRAKMGDAVAKWTTLGMTIEQIQAKQNDILRRAAGLDALALELED